MSFLFRIAAVGGWLAHMSNQTGGLGRHNDHSTKPRLVFVWIFLAVLGAAVFGSDAITSARQSAPTGQIVGGALTSTALAVLALLLVAGVAVHFVPFVALPDYAPRPAQGLRPKELVAVHASGTVGSGRTQRLYRHRPATLERREEGDLKLRVRGLVLWPGSRSRTAAASAVLTPGTVLEINCGTVYLATEARPAINLIGNLGALLLDFDDTNTRDRVYAELASWPGSS